MEVNWDALGAVGELIGALAVFATLVYLAIQAHHSRVLLEENRKIALSQVHQARTLNRIASRRQWIDSPYLAPIFVKLRNAPSRTEGLELLSEEEWIRYRAWCETAMLHQDNNLYQHRLGLLDADKYQGTVEVVLDQMPLWLALDLHPPPSLLEFYESIREAAADDA